MSGSVCKSISNTFRNTVSVAGNETQQYMHLSDITGSLLYWMEKFDGSLCANPRDKIFGLKSIATDGPSITVDYASAPPNLVLQLAFTYAASQRAPTSGIRAWNGFVRDLARPFVNNADDVMSFIETMGLTDKSQTILVDCYSTQKRPDMPFFESFVARITTFRGRSIDVLSGRGDLYYNNALVNLGEVSSFEEKLAGALKWLHRQVRCQNLSSRVSLRDPGGFGHIPTKWLAEIGELQECTVKLSITHDTALHVSQGFYLSSVGVLLLAFLALSTFNASRYSRLSQYRQRYPLGRLCHCQRLNKSQQEPESFLPDTTSNDINLVDLDHAEACWKFINDHRTRAFYV